MSRLALPRKLGIARNLRLSAPVGRISASPYLGQVATLCHIPQQFYAPYTQLMSRRRHIMKDSVTSFQIVLPTFYGTQGTSSEVALSASTTFTAAIEYPSGTFSQVKFGEAATLTAPGGSLYTSDAIALSIPAGAAFWIRIYYTNASGIFYVSHISAPFEDLANEDSCTIGVSGVADQTMGGTVVDTRGDGLIGFTAIAVIAVTTKPSVFVFRDSLTDGPDGPSDASGDIGRTLRAVGANFAYINSGLSGCQLQNWLNNNTYQLAMSQFCSHILCDYTRNDRVLGGRSAAQMSADMQTARVLFPQNRSSLQRRGRIRHRLTLGLRSGIRRLALL
jgi:hypothetical protein